MIIRKLAVPLINEKILNEAEHCYIATASISESAFDFIKSRLSTKCKIDIVTGLDTPTSPAVLERILKHYQDRITLHVYTKNVFHANAYIFDLPYRKSVAFVGSGHFTLEGLKDNEEIFYKIKDPKEIEVLKSWFVGYYEFSEPLTEKMNEEYKWIYPSLKRREIELRREKQQIMALTWGGFNWDNIKFKNQYFKKEDYLTLGSNKASSHAPEIQAERVGVQSKLLALHELIKKNLWDLKLFLKSEITHFVSSVDPLFHPEQKIRAMWIAYGDDIIEGELNYAFLNGGQLRFMQLQIILKQKGLSIRLLPSLADREHFNAQMNDAIYRNAFYKIVSSLKIETQGNHYWFDVAGEKKIVENFQNEDAFSDFIKSDQDLQYDFVIEKTFLPGVPEINTDTIAATIAKEMEKLTLLYRHIQYHKGK